MYRVFAVGIDTLTLKKRFIQPTPDDLIRVRLFRQFVRTWLDPPHPKLTKYRLGVYISKKFKIIHGPNIPNKVCYSLPFRGVNLSFKTKYLKGVSVQEVTSIKNAFGFEQQLGIQLFHKETDSIYVPDNPVLHISHNSLSRGGEYYVNPSELKTVIQKLLDEQKNC